MSAPATAYHSRNPQSSDYYRCVEDHFETFVQIYEERFERQYGFCKEKVFDVVEWLAAKCSHVPDKGEQMVRYYGCYSNVSRGKRQMNLEDDLIPCIIEPEDDSKACRENWARLIRKIAAQK